MLQRLKRTVARVEIDGKPSGTAFLVGLRHVATALHVLDGRSRATLIFMEWDPADRVRTATRTWRHESGHDVAVLELDRPCPHDVEPIPCAAATPSLHSHWMTFGFPAQVPGGHPLPGIHERVSDPSRLVAEWDLRIIQLHTPSAHYDLAGFSGAPCVLDGSVVGIITHQLCRALSDGSVKLLAAPALDTVFALPVHLLERSGLVPVRPALLGPPRDAAHGSLLSPAASVTHLQPARVAGVTGPRWRYRDEIDAFVRHLSTRFVSRAAELQSLTESALARDGGYVCVRAGAALGKSALLAQLLLRLEAGTVDAQPTCIPFFVRHPGWRHADEFLSAVCGQLLRALDRHEGAPSDVTSLRAMFSELWHAAASNSSGKRPLVLIVDGLDEMAQEELTIAHLLPTVLKEHVHVFVSSRPQPDVRTILPPEHPLRYAKELTLEAFGAREVSLLLSTARSGTPPDPVVVHRVFTLSGGNPLMARAIVEDYEGAGMAALAKLEAEPPGSATEYFLRETRSLDAAADDVAWRICELLVAAKGPLSRDELAAILGASPRSVGNSLRRIRRFLSGETRLSFHHHLFHTAIRNELSDGEVLSARNAILAWCNAERKKGWSEGVPRYALEHYAEHLWDARDDDGIAGLVNATWFSEHRRVLGALGLFARDAELVADWALTQPPRAAFYETMGSVAVAAARTSAEAISPSVLDVLIGLGRKEAALAHLDLRRHRTVEHHAAVARGLVRAREFREADAVIADAVPLAVESGWTSRELCRLASVTLCARDDVRTLMLIRVAEERLTYSPLAPIEFLISVATEALARGRADMASSLVEEATPRLVMTLMADRKEWRNTHTKEALANILYLMSSLRLAEKVLLLCPLLERISEAAREEWPIKLSRNTLSGPIATDAAHVVARMALALHSCGHADDARVWADRSLALIERDCQAASVTLDHADIIVSLSDPAFDEARRLAVGQIVRAALDTQWAQLDCSSDAADFRRDTTFAAAVRVAKREATPELLTALARHMESFVRTARYGESSPGEMAMAFAENGRTPEAMHWISAMGGYAGSHHRDEARCHIARVLGTSGQLAEATKLAAAVESSERRSHIFGELAVLALELGRADEADAFVERSMWAGAPVRFVMHRLRLWTAAAAELGRLGDCASGERLLALAEGGYHALGVDARDCDGLAGMAVAYLALGDVDGAERVLERARSSAETVDAMVLLAERLWDRNARGPAKKLAQRIGSGDGEDTSSFVHAFPWRRVQYLKLKAYFGESADARRELGRIQLGKVSASNVALIYSCLARADDHARALEILRSQVTVGGVDASAWDADECLGGLFQRDPRESGDWLWTRAISLRPEVLKRLATWASEIADPAVRAKRELCVAVACHAAGMRDDGLSTYRRAMVSARQAGLDEVVEVMAAGMPLRGATGGTVAVQEVLAAFDDVMGWWERGDPRATLEAAPPRPIG